MLYLRSMPSSASLSDLRGRLPLLLVLGASLTLSLALVAGRVLLTQQMKFVFLLWNLFLAVIPFVLSSLLAVSKAPLKARVLVPVGGVWLLFFPNAPYLLTDLFHLQPRPGIPYWYDLALILSCAWNGLMLAYASLTDMQILVGRRLGTAAGWAFVAVALVLGSFGIYLGRFLRYNSWDVVSDPIALFYDILNRIVHPFSFPGTWGVTLVFGLFLLLGYGTVRLMGRAVE
jgi:uncharacterized membrane protein